MPNTLAELQLSSHDCELCGQYPAEFFIEQHKEWAGKQLCKLCYESLVDQSDGQDDGPGET